MLNFIDPQWDILFSFAILEENQKVRLGYKTSTRGVDNGSVSY